MVKLYVDVGFPGGAAIYQQVMIRELFVRGGIASIGDIAAAFLQWLIERIQLDIIRRNLDAAG